MRITIDFEIRCGAKLDKVGAWKYSEHPTADVICLVSAIGDDDPILWISEWSYDIVKDSDFDISDLDPCLYVGPDIPYELEEAIKKGYEVEAHNAFFERAIWANVMQRKYGWPSIHRNQWRCSAAKAAACALPRSLDGATSALSLDIQKDMSGNQVMLKVSKPRKARKAERKELIAEGWEEKKDNSWARGDEQKWLWNNKPEDFITTWEYCVQDVLAERALSKAIPDLIPKEQKLWQVDQDINLRGVYVDRKLSKTALKMAKTLSDEANEQALLISGGEHFDALSQRDKVRGWIEEQGVTIPNMQKATVDKLLEEESTPEHVQEILTHWQTVSMASIKKYVAILRAASKDGRLRDIVMYHGAGTGRWTGKLVQTQNLKRSSIKDMELLCDVILRQDLDLLNFCYGPASSMEILSWAIRGAFRAPRGRDLIAADYASVEARGLLWLAGDEEGLSYFDHSDIYKEMASSIYDTPVGNVTKAQRSIGKFAILGLGYGMGAKKFADTCAGYGVNISEEFSKKVVKTYREKFDLVPEAWKLLERAAVKAVLYPGKAFRATNLIYKKEGDFLFCQLPSKRRLAYYDPQIRLKMTPWGEEKHQLSYMSIDGITRKWAKTYTYGGKLIENAVQALCRDLMAHAIVKIETGDNPYDIVMHTHDEIVAEVDKDKGSLEEYIALMVKKPKWAKGFPVAASGWRGKRYRKD